MRNVIGLAAIGMLLVGSGGASAQINLLGGLGLAWGQQGGEANGNAVLDLGLPFLPPLSLPVGFGAAGDANAAEGHATAGDASASAGATWGGGLGGLGGLAGIVGTVIVLVPATVGGVVAAVPPVVDAAIGMVPPVLYLATTTVGATLGAIHGIVEEVPPLLGAVAGTLPPVVGAATNLVGTTLGAIDGIVPVLGALGNIAGP